MQRMPQEEICVLLGFIKDDGQVDQAAAEEIDRIMAKHYRFTEEELDIIINYDIKYRMGQEKMEEN